jgi:hypothetical protein
VIVTVIAGDVRVELRLVQLPVPIRRDSSYRAMPDRASLADHEM